MIKTDASGNIQWQKTFGGVNQDHCNAILQLPSGDYVLIGDWDLGGTSDLCVMKLDSAGNELWSKGVTVMTILVLVIRSTMTSDGGFILLGGSNRFVRRFRYVVDERPMQMVIMIWEKTFGDRDTSNSDSG